MDKAGERNKKREGPGGHQEEMVVEEEPRQDGEKSMAMDNGNEMTRTTTHTGSPEEVERGRRAEGRATVRSSGQRYRPANSARATMQKGRLGQGTEPAGDAHQDAPFPQI